MMNQAAEPRLLGNMLAQAFPLEGASCFGELLADIDRASRENTEEEVVESSLDEGSSFSPVGDSSTV